MIKNVVKKAKNRLVVEMHSLGEKKECPICSWTGNRFLPFGQDEKRRLDAKCPRCGSLERHRLAFLVAKKTLHLDYLDTLHIAPEKGIASWLETASKTYISIDKFKPAMQQMDVCDMTFADQRFSLIWCSNVLEHIVDDRAAIAEIYRVCRPDGIAFIQVPIWRQSTIEDAAVTSEEERLARYYQVDHVRLYGLDIVDRFKKVGFSCEIYRAQDFGPVSVTRYALSYISTNEVFLFKK